MADRHGLNISEVVRQCVIAGLAAERLIAAQEQAQEPPRRGNLSKLASRPQG